MLPIFEETPGSAQQGVGGDDNNSPLSNVDWEPAVGCCGGGWEYEMLCEQQGQQVTVSFQVSVVAAVATMTGICFLVQ